MPAFTFKKTHKTKACREADLLSDTTLKSLNKQSITTIEKLAEQCLTKSGRKALAKKTGIAESELKRLTNAADMMRCKTVGIKTCKTLIENGVNSIDALMKHKDGDALFVKLGSPERSPGSITKKNCAKIVGAVRRHTFKMLDFEQ